ncbi:MAG: hypothetical protein ACT4OU_04145 [Hyphomicrobium sp.]
MAKIPNTQRAVWMVLITSIAAPFFASLAEAALSLAGPAFDFAVPPRANKPLGEVAAGAFAWSALPATIAALGLTPYVLQTGGYGWLHAAVAGVLAFTAAVIIWPFEAGDSLPGLAFLAGLVAIGIRAMLIKGGILKP